MSVTCRSAVPRVDLAEVRLPTEARQALDAVRGSGLAPAWTTSSCARTASRSGLFCVRDACLLGSSKTTYRRFACHGVGYPNPFAERGRSVFVGFCLFIGRHSKAPSISRWLRPCSRLQPARARLAGGMLLVVGVGSAQHEEEGKSAALFSGMFVLVGKHGPNIRPKHRSVRPRTVDVGVRHAQQMFGVCQARDRLAPSHHPGPTKPRSARRRAASSGGRSGGRARHEKPRPPWPHRAA